jgi:PAS domain S-box-containing protein
MSDENEVLASQPSPQLLRLFANFAPVAMAMFDQQMRYLVVNRRWQSDFALGDQDLIGRSHYDVFPEIPERWKEIHRRCLAGAVERCDEDAFVRADGTVDWLRWEVRPWRDTAADIGGLIIFSEDVTARKKAELSVRASEEKLRALFEASNVGIALTNSETNYVEFNDAFLRITGYSTTELQSLDYRFLTAEDFRNTTDAQLNRAKRTKRYGPYEKDYVRKDGSRFPVRLNGVQFADGDGQSYIWTIVEDITEQRRLEWALMESTNQEQQKLGRDLHDGLGQELTGIAMLASAAASSLKKAGRSEAAQVEDIANIANLAVGNCRAIAHGMSPLDFAGGSIAAALKEMAALQRESFGIDARCEVTESAPLRLGVNAIESLYRISQEAVANARRHGKANSIRIALNIQPTTVRLTIVDDGIGLSQAPAAPTGMGLKIMEYRAATIGAHLTIERGRQNGTQIIVECPQPLGTQTASTPGATPATLPADA